MTDRYYTLNTFRKIRLLFSVRSAAFLVTCAIILTLIMSCHSSPSPRVLAMKRDAADSVVNGMKDKELAAFRNRKLGFVFQSFQKPKRVATICLR